MIGADVLELRQYICKPARRRILAELFELDFIPAHEAVGMAILGTYCDRDDDDRFVWLRGFSDLSVRAAQLQAFYGGPVWAAHRKRANATMISSDDVLLLRPAFNDERWRLSSSGKATLSELHVLSLARPAGGDALDHFTESIVPAAAASGLTVVGCYVTESAPNAFPALPVREDEHVLMWCAEGSGAIADQGRSELSTAEAQTPGLITAPTIRRLR